MKKINLKLEQFKGWVLSVFIGHYYTEKEVYIILHKMQYEMAQRIIGNRKDQEAVVPIEFFTKHGKYKDTNPFEITKK